MSDKHRERQVTRSS